MRAYCLRRRDKADNIGSKKVTMTNKVKRDKSRCAECVSDKSRFQKQKHYKRSSWNNINLKIFVF